MGEAFNLAEQFQMPVVVLSDQHLADSYTTAAPFAPERVKIDRGKLASGGLRRDRIICGIGLPRMGFRPGFIPVSVQVW